MPEPIDPTEPLPAEPAELRSLSQAYGRTWELELLISGAVTYALLQLPGAVDRVLLRLDAVTVGTAKTVLEYGYAYAKIMLYVLIGGFVLHLASRAYWVGLIGLDAVFPGGVRWDRLGYGPIKEAVHRGRQPRLRALTARVDAFCSLIFSFAWAVVLSFAGSLVGVLLALGLAVLVSRLLLGGERVELAFTLIFGVPALLTLLASAMEHVWPRPAPASPAGRFVATVHRVGLFLVPGVYPLYNVLLSNLNRRLVTGGFMAVIAAVFAVFTVRDRLIPQDRLSAGGYAFLPANAGSRGIDPRFYESLRTGTQGEELLPSIQSEVVRGPFVRLFLPYHPARHNALIPLRCPGVAPLQEGGIGIREAEPDPVAPEAADRVLACLTALQPVALNGVRRDDLGFRFAIHPGSGVRGIVAYLPTRGLPAGENLLSVSGLASPEEADSPAPPHFIPFWFGGAGADSAAPSPGW